MRTHVEGTASGAIDDGLFPVEPIRMAPVRLRISILAGALGLLLVSVITGLLIGPAGLRWQQVTLELLDGLPFVDLDSGLSAAEKAILIQLRLPRVLLGGIVGALLSICGAAYQGVFRNPLADPYLLGAAAGAGLGVTLVISYGPDTIGASAPVAAFLGALLGVVAAYGLGRSGVGSRTTTSLVLAGVAVTSFLTALQTYFQQRRSETLREVYGWILGRLATSGWDEVITVIPYALVSIVVILIHRRLLDVIAVGDDEAGSLGLRIARLRLILVIAASLGTAAAVSVSGLIGFVGLIVPHVVRLMAGTSYRVVLPLSVIVGAAFMISSDILARTIASPAELPIGVVTAFFGAPFFLVVLRTSRRIS